MFALFINVFRPSGWQVGYKTFDKKRINPRNIDCDSGQTK